MPDQSKNASTPHSLGKESLSQRADRASGAILGVLIGDALGLGTHWYYDMEALHREHGEWVDHYVDPKPNGNHAFAKVSQFRYEQGLRAGDISQTGQIYRLLMDSLSESGTFGLCNFFQKLDSLYATLNGKAYSGRYTESLQRELLKKRRSGIRWDSPDMPTAQDVSDGAQLVVLLAALYQSPEDFAKQADSLLSIMYGDKFLRGSQIAYGLVVNGLINGVTVDGLNDYMRSLASNPEITSRVGGYDTFLTPSYGAVAQQQHLVSLPEPKYISHVFGTDCQVMHLLPAAYYLLYRYPKDFELATLSASNGGGNNMARAALAGALAGAANGISRIPKRFIDDLRDGTNLQAQAEKIAEFAE